MGPRRGTARLPAVTLTTDIGWAYAAQMKAVLAHYLPAGKIYDLSHELPAFRVGEAAFLLRHLAGGFPSGSIHVGVIDPGVGGQRVPIIIVCREGSRLVGPDNGLLMPLADHLGIAATYRIRPEKVLRSGRSSATFEGRDIFAPTAGRLATGARPDDLGVPWSPHRLASRAPQKNRSALRGTVVHVDRFGNLITDIPGGWLPKAGGKVRVSLGGRASRLLPRVRTYEELRRGSAGVLTSSFGLVEVSAREAHLSNRYHIGAGASVSIEPAAGSPRHRAPRR